MEIAALEKDVREVAEMFKEVAVLVNSQQDGIDTMEKNVQSAKKNAEEGAKELDEARPHYQPLLSLTSSLRAAIRSLFMSCRLFVRARVRRRSCKLRLARSSAAF